MTSILYEGVSFRMVGVQIMVEIIKVKSLNMHVKYQGTISYSY